MPSVYNNGPDSVTILYDQANIDDILRITTRPAAKLILTDKGEYGSNLDKHYGELVKDFSQLSIFKLQHQTRETWYKQYSSSDDLSLMQTVIKNTISASFASVPGDTDDARLSTFASAHLKNLQKTYQGFGFATPLLIFQKIALPLGLIVTTDTTTAYAKYNKSIDLYYDTAFNYWVVEIYNQIKITDPNTGSTIPIQFGITAIFPTDIEAKSISDGGFRLTQMVITGSTKHVDAFDCFLNTRNNLADSQDYDYIDLKKALQPLQSYIDMSDSIVGASAATKAAADRLKYLLQCEDNILPAFDTYSEIIPILNAPGPLHTIVVDLGFLIAIKLPHLYQALNICRKISAMPPMPQVTAAPIAPPPHMLPQRKDYDITQLCTLPFIAIDYETSELNRLMLNKHCSYGIMPHSEANGHALAQDFGEGMLFNGGRYNTYNSAIACVKDKLTNPKNYPATLDCLHLIITNEVIPLIHDPWTLKTYPTCKAILSGLSLEILKRAYQHHVGLTPCYVLENAIKLFSSQCQIRSQPERHLYLCKEQKKWVLKTRDTLIFEVMSNTPWRFQQRLEYTTTAHIAQHLPMLMDLDDYQNPRNWPNQISTEYSNGFVLTAMQLDGHGHYIKLFNDIIAWDRTTYPDFRIFITQDLLDYIEKIKKRNPVAKYVQEKTQHAWQTPTVKLSAANKLYDLLTKNFHYIHFTDDEKKALCDHDLGNITLNLSFLIGIKAPWLYRDLILPHQNPLVSSMYSHMQDL